MTHGYLSLQPRPVRVSNCTRSPSMPADMRKPSSLTHGAIAACGAVSTGWESWGGIQTGSGEGASRRARDALVLVASAAERFTTRAMNGNSRCRTRTLSPHSLTQINARMPQIADGANVRSGARQSPRRHRRGLFCPSECSGRGWRSCPGPTFCLLRPGGQGRAAHARTSGGPADEGVSCSGKTLRPRCAMRRFASARGNL